MRNKDNWVEAIVKSRYTSRDKSTFQLNQLLQNKSYLVKKNKENEN